MPDKLALYFHLEIRPPMKRIALFVLPVPLALASLALGQAAATKPATPAAKRSATSTATAGPKLPPGVPVVHGIVKTAFALRYEDVKIGTGKPAAPGQLYKVHYTGWLASDGKKFDSSFDHRRPVLDKDGKPENDADGKPKLGEPEPIQFPQGRRGVIPGWDQGFSGMKVGGKRRLFIPYQLAYGELGRPPVIPPKSDLIFDIELVDVTELPAAPMRPNLPVHPATPVAPGAAPNNAPGTPAPPAGQPATQPTTPPPATPTKPTDPTQPTTAPNSAPTPKTPPPPPATQPTAPPDKPANPEQPPAHN